MNSQLYKGIFWYDCVQGILITRKVACDKEGVSFEAVEYSSKSSDNFNHKAEWEKLPQSVTMGYDYNYYPRDRVEIKNGRITVYLNPDINLQEVRSMICVEFGLPPENATSKVRFVSDGSVHYSYESELFAKFRPNRSSVKLRLLICGGRHFSDYETLSDEAEKILSDYSVTYADVEIVSGHCEGADQLGERFAKEHGMSLKIFPAEWKKYGRAAGPIRNKKMVEYISECDRCAVLAFVSKNTKGTNNTLSLAKAKGIRTVKISYTAEEIKDNDKN